MRLLTASLAALSLLSGLACNAPLPGLGHAIPILPPPSFTRPPEGQMSNYVATHANSLRNGRVRAPRRTLQPFVRVAALVQGNPTAESLPEVISLGPGGSVLLDRALGAQVIGPAGAVVRNAMKFPGEPIATGVAGFALHGTFYGWESGEASEAEAGNARAALGMTLVQRYEGSRLLVAFQLRSGRDLWRDTEVRVVCVDAPTPGGKPTLVWNDRVLGRGVSAIDGASRTALAMIDGRFVVLSSEPSTGPLDTADDVNDAGLSRRHVWLDRRHRAGAAYDLSVVEDGYVLVSGAPPIDPSARPEVTYTSPKLDEIRMETAMPFAFKKWTSWKTWVHMLDFRGEEGWVVEVPFSVRQPGIDGGGGRVVVSGDELAAIEKGAIVWRQRLDKVALTTAFENGDLAVASGNILYTIARGGAIAQQIQTPDAVAISTLPAIAEDGSVWVATANALYVARPETGN